MKLVLVKNCVFKGFLLSFNICVNISIEKSSQTRKVHELKEEILAHMKKKIEK